MESTVLGAKALYLNSRLYSSLDWQRRSAAACPCSLGGYSCEEERPDIAHAGARGIVERLCRDLSLKQRLAGLWRALIWPLIGQAGEVAACGDLLPTS